MSDVQIISIAVAFLVGVTAYIVFIQVRDHFDGVHKLKICRLRLEIIDGMLFARQHCSEIESIKSRPGVEAALKSAFGLTEVQIKAIMKLKKPLRGMSEESMREERQRLLDEIGSLEERTGKRTKPL
jgi:DNA gyrase/topoisomerase IV subunit A